MTVHFSANLKSVNYSDDPVVLFSSCVFEVLKSEKMNVGAAGCSITLSL